MNGIDQNNMEQDPKNWIGGFLYCNPKDKRLYLNKKLPGFGFTINFGNPYAYLIIGTVAVLTAMAV